MKIVKVEEVQIRSTNFQEKCNLDIKSDRKQSSAFSSNSIFRIKAWIFLNETSTLVYL